MASTTESYRQQQQRRMPRRYYGPRTAAHGLVALSLFAILIAGDYPPWLWFCWALYGFAWPHLAYLHSSRAPRPARAELRNLYSSAIWHGFWIATIDFSLVPSVMLVAILGSESYGGLRIYLRGLVAVALGIVIGGGIFGWGFAPHTGLWPMVATLPALLLFPVVYGLSNFDLWQRLMTQTEEAIRLSRVDGLTTLMNREYFENRMLLEFQRCKRGGPVATFVLIDIDHFKRINDQYGHLAGDSMLRRVASVLKAQTREVDHVGRYGGEEFGICLVNTNAENALAVVERLRRAVEREVSETERGIRCTVSCGVAEFSDAFKRDREWFEQADKALYRAKDNGRNRTEVMTKAVTDAPEENSVAPALDCG